jgi:hypothetical protein
MKYLLLEYTRSGFPPEEDLTKISNLVSKIVLQRNPCAWEVEISSDIIGDLQLLLPNWELSIIGYYGIPELGESCSDNGGKPVSSLNDEEILNIESRIRKYLIMNGNQSKLANLVSATTSKDTRWQHVLEAIESSSDIKEDGKNVWLDMKMN